MSRPLQFAALIALSGLLLGGGPAFSADSKIGVASAVKNQVEGRGARPLSVGSDVFANERIRTGDSASAQLLFLDKTVLSLGPKAELLLDKFVFNPNRGGGQVVVNAVQGSMRFITGAQNPTNYAIKTPVATLGIRGTVIDLSIIAGRTFIGVAEGTVTIRLNDGTSFTLNKGQSITILANGKPKGPPEPYDGTDPSLIEVNIPGNRIDDINQLNAIDARGYVPKKPDNPCYIPPYYYCY